jgi:hypothetical protein
MLPFHVFLCKRESIGVMMTVPGSSANRCEALGKFAFKGLE